MALYTTTLVITLFNQNVPGGSQLERHSLLTEMIQIALISNANCDMFLSLVVDKVITADVKDSTIIIDHSKERS